MDDLARQRRRLGAVRHHLGPPHPEPCRHPFPAGLHAASGTCSAASASRTSSPDPLLVPPSSSSWFRGSSRPGQNASAAAARSGTTTRATIGSTTASTEEQHRSGSGFQRGEGEPMAAVPTLSARHRCPGIGGRHQTAAPGFQCRPRISAAAKACSEPSAPAMTTSTPDFHAPRASLKPSFAATLYCRARRGQGGHPLRRPPRCLPRARYRRRAAAGRRGRTLPPR